MTSALDKILANYALVDSAALAFAGGEPDRECTTARSELATLRKKAALAEETAEKIRRYGEDFDEEQTQWFKRYLEIK